MASYEVDSSYLLGVSIETHALITPCVLKYADSDS